jgi:hypothetical protein
MAEAVEFFNYRLQRREQGVVEFLCDLLRKPVRPLPKGRSISPLLFELR